MKKILFLHGFTSSGSCEIAETLRAELNGIADIVAPDIPLHPFKALEMLKDICSDESFDLVVGSSCGAFYGQQLVSLTWCPAVLISPYLKMTEFLSARFGLHDYKSKRIDGIQQFEITQDLVDEFADMEELQFDCYEKFNRNRVWGMFGSKDAIAHFRNLFLEYYDIAIDYDGPHTMTEDNVRFDLVPVVQKMLETVKPMRDM